MDHIKIDRYDSRIINGKICHFAIAGKKEYPMPDAYQEMYDDKHLAIREQYTPFKELFDLPNEKHWIPLYTGDVSCQKKIKQ